MIIPGREVVVGDIVVLEKGDVIPADLRIIESNYLQLDTSALTGESDFQVKIARFFQCLYYLNYLMGVKISHQIAP